MAIGEPVGAAEHGEWDFPRCGLALKPALLDLQNLCGLGSRVQRRSAVVGGHAPSWRYISGLAWLFFQIGRGFPCRGFAEASDPPSVVTAWTALPSRVTPSIERPGSASTAARAERSFFRRSVAAMSRYRPENAGAPAFCVELHSAVCALTRFARYHGPATVAAVEIPYHHAGLHVAWLDGAAVCLAGAETQSRRFFQPLRTRFTFWVSRVGRILLRLPGSEVDIGPAGMARRLRCRKLSVGSPTRRKNAH